MGTVNGRGAGTRKGIRRAAWVAAGAVVLSVVGVGAAPHAEAKGIRYLQPVFSKVTVTKDIVYGRSRTRRGQLQQHELDVIEPAGDTAAKRAAVVWVHGGYFKYGSKQDEYYQRARDTFSKAGYVTISIDYTLNPDIPDGAVDTVLAGQITQYIDTVKDAQHDAQAAVRWTRAHAAQYRIDPNKIAVAGHSAGGITASLVGFNEHDPGTNGTPGVSSRVAATVAFAGTSVPGLLVQVDPGDPPFQIIHGIIDDVVPSPPALSTCALTLALGNVCEQVYDPDQRHGMFGYDQALSFLYRRMITVNDIPLPLRVDTIGLDSLPTVGDTVIDLLKDTVG
jgi:predicted esterase